MADYYTLFSSALVLESNEERSWSNKRLTELTDGFVETGDGDKFPGDFEWGLMTDSETSRPYVWFHSEESGSVEHVASFVQEFLKKWRPNGCWVLTWANTCSKPRLEGFAGGGVFVTANKQVWVVPQEMLGDLVRDFENSKPKGKSKKK